MQLEKVDRHDMKGCVYCGVALLAILYVVLRRIFGIPCGQRIMLIELPQRFTRIKIHLEKRDDLGHSLVINLRYHHGVQSVAKAPTAHVTINSQKSSVSVRPVPSLL